MMAKMTPEERRRQCRQASLSRSPEQRKADAQKAAAASVKSRFGEDRDLIKLDKLESQLNAATSGKHEVTGSDPAKVFRAAGLGEHSVARMVRRLAEKAKSEVVRLRALELAAKILRMVSDAPQQQQGVAIFIEAAEPQTKVNIVAPGPASEPMGNHPKPSRPGGPVFIVK
jgi:hypothetical protein